MRVLHVCSEFFPLIKTGGLADVTGALPYVQSALGIDARVLLPGFPAIKKAVKGKLVARVSTWIGTVDIKRGNYRGVILYYIDAPELFERGGNPYQDSYHNDYADNYLRFAILGLVAKKLACSSDKKWKPDIVHAHDWHAGLACAYIKQSGCQTKCVFTIHNLAYQGLFPTYHFAELGIKDFYAVEFYGHLSYLKAGIVFADHVTTVSPTYANEICTAEFGCGMEGVLKQKQLRGELSGILNGVDYKVWHPYFDPHLVKRYGPNQLEHKLVNKLTLQTQFGLPESSDALLVGVVSRLTYQKGLDLITPAIEQLFAHGGQFILLGNGDESLQERFSQLEQRYPDQVGISFCYDETLSHQIIAGSDALLVPSRFEPCGLTQLYALKYGTLPIVRRTGGLSDTVIDENGEQDTGFAFNDADEQAVSWAMMNAIRSWKIPKVWRKRQINAMKADFSWKKAAKTYSKLYKQLINS